MIFFTIFDHVHYVLKNNFKLNFIANEMEYEIKKKIPTFGCCAFYFYLNSKSFHIFLCNATKYLPYYYLVECVEQWLSLYYTSQFDTIFFHDWVVIFISYNKDNHLSGIDIFILLFSFCKVRKWVHRHEVKLCDLEIKRKKNWNIICSIGCSPTHYTIWFSVFFCNKDRFLFFCEQKSLIYSTSSIYGKVGFKVSFNLFLFFFKCTQQIFSFNDERRWW